MIAKLKGEYRVYKGKKAADLLVKTLSTQRITHILAKVEQFKRVTRYRRLGFELYVYYFPNTYDMLFPEIYHEHDNKVALRIWKYFEDQLCLEFLRR